VRRGSGARDRDDFVDDPLAYSALLASAISQLMFLDAIFSKLFVVLVTCFAKRAE
jgi:hypothetical protein